MLPRLRSFFTIKPLFVSLGVMAFMACNVSLSAAQSIADLKAKGKVVVGIQTQFPPYGFMDRSGEIAGYDADVARYVADKLGVELEFQPILTSNRIPLLLTGKIDLIIGTLGMYAERAKQVQFSKPYSSFDINVIGPKVTTLTDIDGLADLRVSVPRGSAPDVTLTKELPASADIQRFDDDSMAIQALLSGQVDFMGGTTVYMLNIDKVAPGRFEQKLMISRQYNGVGVRPQQKELLDAVNSAIDSMKESDELNKISQRWFNADTPEFPESLPGIPFTIE